MAAKELADHVLSVRFVILFAIVAVAGLASIHSASNSIRQVADQASGTPSIFLYLFTVSPDRVPAFNEFIGFLGPLLGIALGFDALSSERSQRTLPRLVSQPIHRDDIINGKFAAGVAAIALAVGTVIAVVAGYGIVRLGLVPSASDVTRLVMFFVVSVIYISLWLAVAILFSTLSRRSATTALATIALWLAMTFFAGLLSGAIADAVHPTTATARPSRCWPTPGWSRASTGSARTSSTTRRRRSCSIPRLAPRTLDRGGPAPRSGAADVPLARPEPLPGLVAGRGHGGHRGADLRRGLLGVHAPGDPGLRPAACQPWPVPFWSRRRGRPLPSGWEGVVARSLGEWHYLAQDERSRLGDLIERLLAGKGWEAAHGFTLTDEMCTVIAAQAALVVLGLDLDAYRDVRAIIVHPTTVTSRSPRAGPVPGVMTDSPVDLLGQAHQQRGPVVLAWDAASADARHPGTGSNVVVHEFAHKLDMLDGLVDGTPPVRGREAYDRWVRVCSAEYERLRAGPPDPLLRDYAAQDPGEFFAVAAELLRPAPAHGGAEAGPLRRLRRLLLPGPGGASARRRLRPGSRLRPASGAPPAQR